MRSPLSQKTAQSHAINHNIKSQASTTSERKCAPNTIRLSEKARIGKRSAMIAKRRQRTGSKSASATRAIAVADSPDAKEQLRVQALETCQAGVNGRLPPKSVMS
jgi:hypothetical protein